MITDAGFELLSLPPVEEPKQSLESGYAGWLGTSWQEDAAQTARLVEREARADWLIVDHYSLDSRWESELAGSVAGLFVIDDLANRTHACDVLLDQNFYAGLETRYDSLVPSSTQRLLGPSFAILRPEFGLKRAQGLKDRRDTVRNILVFMGGVDATNMTGRSLEALGGLLPPDCEVDVVVTPSNPWRTHIASLCDGDPRLKFHLGADMAELSSRADVAVAAGGSALWERCCLGLPSIVVPVAENQRVAADDLANHGAILLARPETLEAELPALWEQLLSSPDLRQRLAATSAALVDGHGAERICRSLMQASGNR